MLVTFGFYLIIFLTLKLAEQRFYESLVGCLATLAKLGCANVTMYGGNSACGITRWYTLFTSFKQVLFKKIISNTSFEP